ncbi:CpaB family protein [Actinoallomurus soli]|uniref:hypothetical protein n=1 Tax=Actinoallomurus soli TaxID=2952535 RepID=UPI002093273D|nr:hypothetical protein [Actinoallomurus soli]MCO5969322.1 hypothetical protein [Actinoallomurus soli]
MTTSSDRKSVADTPGRPSLAVAAGHRIPVPPRERKPAMAALAVLLIVGGALVSAYLVMVSGQRVPVIRVAKPVAAGQRIPASALEEVQVSAAGGLDYIPWRDRAKVTQTYATVTLVSGSLLTNGMISTAASAAKGTVVVGLALKPGQLPAGGLRPGDRVAVYAVAVEGQTGIQAGAVLAPVAMVYDVAGPGQNDIQSDQVQVSVTVPTDEAPLVTQAASAGAVAVAVLAPGEQASGKRAHAVTVPSAVPPTPQQSATARQPAPDRTTRRPASGASGGPTGRP